MNSDMGSKNGQAHKFARPGPTGYDRCAMLVVSWLIALVVSLS